jgi:hypothetical protein
MASSASHRADLSFDLATIDQLRPMQEPIDIPSRILPYFNCILIYHHCSILSPLGTRDSPILEVPPYSIVHIGVRLPDSYNRTESEPETQRGMWQQKKLEPIQDHHWLSRASGERLPLVASGMQEHLTSGSPQSAGADQIWKCAGQRTTQPRVDSTSLVMLLEKMACDTRLLATMKKRMWRNLSRGSISTG